LAEINWTVEAENWLRDIYNYIASDNPDAAAQTVAAIYEKVQLLGVHPRLGHKYEPNNRVRSAFYSSIITASRI